MTIAALAMTARSAVAATPCHSVEVEGMRVRVAKVGLACREARQIAVTYFERILNGDSYDGKTRDGSTFYSVRGFRCLTGLGGSQMFCRHGDRRVFASDRPEDHPSTWTLLARTATPHEIHRSEALCSKRRSKK